MILFHYLIGPQLLFYHFFYLSFIIVLFFELFQLDPFVFSKSILAYKIIPSGKSKVSGGNDYKGEDDKSDGKEEKKKTDAGK